MSEWMDAIRAGDAARVEALVTADPSVLNERENGVTPLLLALYHGKRDVAQVIAAHMPELPMPEACAMGALDRVKELLARDPSALDRLSADGFPPVGLAIFFGQPAVAQFLIAEGADVNAFSQNEARLAPVHAAAAVCDRDTMRMLLAHGADVNAKQRMDFTPLHGAASRGDIEMARLLLAHGADRAAKTTDGMDAVAIAEKYGKGEFAAWIRSAASAAE